LRFSVHSEYAVMSLGTAPRKPFDILKIRPIYRLETSRTNYPEARDVTCQTNGYIALALPTVFRVAYTLRITHISINLTQDCPEWQLWFASKPTHECHRDTHMHDHMPESIDAARPLQLKAAWSQCVDPNSRSVIMSTIQLLDRRQRRTLGVAWSIFKAESQRTCMINSKCCIYSNCLLMLNSYSVRNM
jgi:hypothetical protein